ncbi:MAG TPA: FecR family protein [Bryobacteraceae bacterium]|nr:FecR family protein [Bryobacteraceae bacterium]
MLIWRGIASNSHRLLPFVSAFLAVPTLLAVDIDSSALQKDAALVVSASGQVSTERKGQEWAVAAGQRIWVTKPIITGTDGYANFQVAGSTSFEVFAHTRLVFRKNAGNPQDLLDIDTGRVGVQVYQSGALPFYRIITPVAIIVSHGSASLAIAVDDEDKSVRVDVRSGEISVQHALLPQANPVIVGAGDAIEIQADEPLALRKLDRGSLYQYAFHAIWKTLASTIPGHFNFAGGSLGGRIFAMSRMQFCPGNSR